jgi:hypothetical protein
MAMVVEMGLQSIPGPGQPAEEFHPADGPPLMAVAPGNPASARNSWSGAATPYNP